MKILLAGPGTGKTTRVKTLIKEDYGHAENILVLSFTNATVRDLQDAFADHSNVKVHTLHSYALMVNHLPDLYILRDKEPSVLEAFATKIDVRFRDVCKLFNCITFGDMVCECTVFIRSNPVYARKTIGKLDLLIVDEFQDFNATERDLINLIANQSSETILLGDDDQSIYSFKDADPDGIIDAYKNPAISRIAHPNICYRCPDSVVTLGAKLITLNQNRIDKQWNPYGNEGSVIGRQFMTHTETHDFVVSEITRIREVIGRESFLVLSPVSFLVPDLLDRFRENGVEYVDFWISSLEPNIREMIRWLMALYGPHKSIHLLLLLQGVSSYMKKKVYNGLGGLLRNGCDTEAIIDLLETLNPFKNSISEYISKPIPIEELLSKHPEFGVFDDFIEADNVQGSLQELESKMNPAPVFDKEQINVMSIYKSKGLQADNVFILDLNDGVIPNNAKGLDSKEAQRRLLFVGMSRTIKRLYMVSTVEWEGKWVNRVDKSKFKYDHRSRCYKARASTFIDEMALE